MAPLHPATRYCAICEANICDRASNVRYCSKRCRWRKNRLAKIRKFEPKRAAAMLARYVEEEKREATPEREHHGMDAVTRKKLENSRPEGAELPPSEPKRAELAPVSLVGKAVCCGDCPKCGCVWRGSKSCSQCGHGFKAVLF